MKVLHYTDDQAMKAIRLRAVNLGRRPNFADFGTAHNRWNGLSGTTIHKRFGGFKQAMELAGVNAMPEYRPFAFSPEYKAYHHPVEQPIDRWLHAEQVKHKHWVVTRELVCEVHALFLPIVAVAFPSKSGPIPTVAMLFGPEKAWPEWAHELFEQEFMPAARQWVQSRLNAELIVVYPDKLFDLVPKLLFGLRIV